MDKITSFRKNEIISASEIGQYTYCSIAWFLQRCGYKPDSPLLESGKKNHIYFGEKIDTIQNKLSVSKRLITGGILLLITAIFLTIIEVIL